MIVYNAFVIETDFIVAESVRTIAATVAVVATRSFLLYVGYDQRRGEREKQKGVAESILKHGKLAAVLWSRKLTVYVAPRKICHDDRD